MARSKFRISISGNNLGVSRTRRMLGAVSGALRRTRSYIGNKLKLANPSPIKKYAIFRGFSNKGRKISSSNTIH